MIFATSDEKSYCWWDSHRSGKVPFCDQFCFLNLDTKIPSDTFILKRGKKSNSRPCGQEIFCHRHFIKFGLKRLFATTIFSDYGKSQMNQLEERYDVRTAAAWILGHAKNTGVPKLPETVVGKTVDECTNQEIYQMIEAGQDAGLKLYPFKAGKQVLPRIRRVMGFLHSAQFETMLDVGSGRGAFLIPFIKEFPSVQVTSLDLLETRVTFLNELSAGGFSKIRAEQKNICEQPFPDKAFDIVTMLEVLEHIPEVEKAVAAAVRMAKQYVIVTAPSKPDDNPEHIHLLTKEVLTKLFSHAGCEKLHFDGVEGHLFLVAVVKAK